MGTQSETYLYEFGLFRLDTRQRLLSCEGKIVPLPPKTIHLLVVLVQNHGRLLEKDELMGAVWPDTTVEESALAKGIHLLRKTLGESVIVTFPKRGYTFAAPLTECDNATAVDPLPDIPGQPPPPPVFPGIGAPWVERRSSRIAWVVAAAALLVLLAVSSLALKTRKTTIESVAVVPFQSTLGQDPGLAEGFTQELAARLRTLPGLRVVSPFFTRDVRELGNRLGVEAVLTGSLQHSGRRLRASAQLLGARDGSVLWADQGEEFDADDLYAAQRVLASSIASRLRGRVLPAEMPALLHRGSTNTEAYEAFVRGRAELARHAGVPDRASPAKARAFFERAVQLDPGFSDAWGWLAFAKQTEFMRGHAGRALLGSAAEDAQRALSIDPDSIAARLALIRLYHSTGQEEEALRLAARALQINSRDPESTLAAATAYFRTGMLDRAADLYERYLVSYPEDEIARFDLIHVAVFADTYERGLRAAQPGLAAQRLSFPTFLLCANSGDFAHAIPLVRQALASSSFVAAYFGPLVLKAAGRDEEAASAWRDVAAKLSSMLATADNERIHMWLAMTYAQLKRPDDAREQIRLALALNPEDPWILFFASETYALLEDRVAALQALSKSVAAGFVGLHYLDYYQKPLYGWNRYRTDPEFLAIRDGLARKIADLRKRY